MVESVADVALSLALEVVGASTTPLLLLDGQSRIIAASESFVLAFGTNVPALVGRSLETIGSGEWALPRLHSLLAAALGGATDIAAYEIDLKSPTLGLRRLVLHAHRLAHAIAPTAGDDGVRLLLSIADVTDARASERVKDALLRENALRIEEVQHRVANSLQIIASVLMQSARKVSSEEARLHLRDAHGRVLAISTLQRHLAETSSDTVDLGTYLHQLCQSLSASMIEDPVHTSLRSRCNNCMVSANASVSIGLVVTELVINALKHAFPGNRPGAIVVDYHCADAAWTLQVSDNGVGMPPEAARVGGLGSSIVSALARHLEAEVVVGDGRPGTTISLVHRETVADDELAEPAV